MLNGCMKSIGSRTGVCWLGLCKLRDRFCFFLFVFFVDLFWTIIKSGSPFDTSRKPS